MESNELNNYIITPDLLSPNESCKGLRIKLIFK